MRRHRSYFLIAPSLSVMLIGIIFLLQQNATPVAQAAAPKQQYSLYLPLVVKGSASVSSSTPTPINTPTATSTPTNTPTATSTPTNTPTATSTFTPTSTPTGVTPSQLIRDGSFEAGLPSTSWTIASNMASNILDSSTNPPAHTGAWKAWLGGANLAQESLAQTFAVPAGTTSLQVSFWWRVSTTEPSPQTFDRLDVRLRNSAGAATLQNLYTYYDGDAGSIWRQGVFTPTLSYAGQTIQIAFVVQNDANNPTSFFIDDVSVLANP